MSCQVLIVGQQICELVLNSPSFGGFEVLKSEGPVTTIFSWQLCVDELKRMNHELMKLDS